MDQVVTVVPVRHQGGLYQSGSSDGKSGVSGICFAVESIKTCFLIGRVGLLLMGEKRVLKLMRFLP